MEKIIDHKLLIRFAKTIKETDIELLGSVSKKSKKYNLYKVGKLLAITINDGLVIEWDEEFDFIWNTCFNQNNQKSN